MEAQIFLICASSFIRFLSPAAAKDLYFLVCKICSECLIGSEGKFNIILVEFLSTVKSPVKRDSFVSRQISPEYYLVI